ncbi:histone deacetylase complex subunit SAP130a [Gouania willdenowi]|uniref:Histone deacetylase complex subunit SAP130 C-terminal domain-containing protein n=1 Tax=Gouania willdenowi TaxID=441366 RepID=A0A8C5DCZ4_GOUWI|nr:histone deacetylase complex subunit SAP130 [Gouania willdenowi]XP_028300931.1 histone deacetylase complex subunit SAP130 [Gouania willdenowi]XP_028300932.1 histone deacetylase complex subunit SAP130 [Gouania willdenowi]XP_028300933.1 histone deacetylase complex subunit SAP130 [Gouania willdenowi]
MSSQQFPRHGLPVSSGGPAQITAAGTLVSVTQPPAPPGGGGDADSGRDAEHIQQDHLHPPPLPPPPAAVGGTIAFRDDKQETMVVRPYPQIQAHGQTQLAPQALPLPAGTPVTVTAPPVHLPHGQPAVLTEGQMKAVLKSPMPSRLIAPAPASNQAHIPIPPKVPGHITVTIESSIAPTSSIPVATISGQQGHSSNLHHLMSANIQIIRGSAPALQIGTPAVPSQTFTSHLPRGAAAAAVMSSSKTVLRPATGASAGPGQPTVQHIIHQTIQSRPAVTTSTAVLPTVVAPISATRTQSPIISPSVTHSAEVAHGRPALTIHPPPTVSIQRPQVSRDTATRITLPSHPAIGAQKPQPPHTMAQKPIFSTVTPVAAATVAPIVATNTVPSTTAIGTIGSVPHTQMSSNTIVTMTMASHSSHATAVTTSAIPVAKVVPQPIAHSSSRVQPDYTGDRTNLIPIPGHRSSPNPVTMETRNDNRPSVPVQFQYFLPTYSTSYPLTHNYTPISSSVSTIRQYPVTPQAPSSALPTQAGVGVATTVHLNHMQLMAVDRIGLPSAQISTQNIQPAPITAQGIQPAPLGVQGLHTPASMATQGLQQAPSANQQQQSQAEAKPGVVLADGFVASPISSAFSTSQPVATMVQAHTQGGVGGAPTLVSSPRPSILRKKPTTEGCVRKNLIPAQSSEPSGGRLESGVRGAGSPRPAGVKPKAEVHMAVAPPVHATIEALPTQGGEQQAMSSSIQHIAQAIPTMLTTPGAVPPSQASTVLTSLPGAIAVTPPVPASMANTVASPTQPAASSTAACAANASCPELKIKQEVESMDTSQPDPNVNLPSALAPQASTLSAPPGDLIPGASPRKKPRKQQHIISTEESEMVETNSTDEEKIPGRPITGRAERRESPPREYVDEEGVRYVPVKPRPPVTLLRHYRNPWKAAYHHFQRYSDIRVKEEKKGTLQEMANQRGVACRAQGWKLHLCAAQLRQLSGLEHDVYSRLSSLQEGLIPKKRAGADDDLHRINELIQGNMQRSKLVMDQVTEARDTMMKVLDHKEKVLKLLNKNGTVKKSSKMKRKERA